MLFFTFVFCRLVLGYFALFVSDLCHSESELHSIYFFWIPDFVRKVVTGIAIFSQLDGPMGKPNQPVHWVLFTGTIIRVLFFVCIISLSFGVRIALRLFFSIPDSLRKVLENFEIFA